MGNGIQPADLRFFSVLAGAGSLGAAARELGITTPAVSKHLALMERRLGVPLVNRTTRRMGLTPEGELYLAHARRILGEIDDLEQLLGTSRGTPTGLLRVNATLGFGRSHVAPLISDFARRHPQLEVQLQLSVNPPPLTDDSFDVCIRFGAPPDARVVARHIAPNRRLLCAAPAYLARHGTPRGPQDLTAHEVVDYVSPTSGRSAPWEWVADGQTHTAQPRSRVSANNAETYIACALAGLGLIQIPAFDVQHHLRSGELVALMPEARAAPMPVHLVYPHRKHLSRRLQAFMLWLQALMAPHLGAQA